MIEALTDIMISVFKTSPLLAFMGYAIYYLSKENKELKDETKELNKYVRDSEVKNTQILAGVSATLDKLVDKADDNNDSLKEWISIKLENIKGK